MIAPSLPTLGVAAATLFCTNAIAKVRSGASQAISTVNCSGSYPVFIVSQTNQTLNLPAG